MAFSLKKRVKSKSHVRIFLLFIIEIKTQILIIIQIISNGNDDRTALGEVLDLSTKKKQKKKKKYDQLLNSHQQIPSIDSDISINTPSLTNENPIIYRNRCLCETHYDKQLLENNYEIKIDRLFDLIFGSNEFVRKYRQAQRFYGLLF